jgi:hypothetical protein
MYLSENEKPGDPLKPAKLMELITVAPALRESAATGNPNDYVIAITAAKPRVKPWMLWALGGLALLFIFRKV